MSGTDFAVVVAAVLVGALVKSVTGMGLPLVAIPIMTIFMPTETAVAVIALPNVAQNLTLVYRFREWRSAVRLLPAFCVAGVLGAVAGAFALDVVDERVLQVALLVMVSGYLISAMTHPDLAITDRAERIGTVPVGALAGLFQGAIGISGPVVGTWHHGLKLHRDAFVFSIATVFTLTGAAQAIVLGAQGKYADRWAAIAVVAVIVLVTVPVGSRLRTRLPVVWFHRLVLVLLGVSCISLVLELAKG
ncbi:MAG TPA: sulfite exporter TauE/SafE family protein [Ilumatobacter sp.]|nr:sulfite exporter TauE/SafE family protein [Ilumatobacter sp.]